MYNLGSLEEQKGKKKKDKILNFTWLDWGVVLLSKPEKNASSDKLFWGGLPVRKAAKSPKSSSCRVPAKRNPIDHYFQTSFPTFWLWNAKTMSYTTLAIYIQHLEIKWKKFGQKQIAK